jgi:hypothetical protein
MHIEAPWQLFPDMDPRSVLTDNQGTDPYASAWWAEYLPLSEAQRQAYLDAQSCPPAWRAALAQVMDEVYSVSPEELQREGEAYFRDREAQQETARKTKRWWHWFRTPS